jgi:hypothetical protein
LFWLYVFQPDRKLLVSVVRMVHAAPEQHVWSAPSQPDRRHLSCIVAKMILDTYKSDVHPPWAGRSGIVGGLE